MSCRQHIAQSFLKLTLKICSLIGKFRQFTLNVVIDILELSVWHFIFLFLFVLFFISLFPTFQCVTRTFFRIPFWFVCSVSEYIAFHSILSGCSRYYIINIMYHSLLVLTFKFTWNVEIVPLCPFTLLNISSTYIENCIRHVIIF